MAILKPFQLAIVVDIIKSYKWDKPFHLYFNQLAKQHRNWGAKDRKIYRKACYAYLRLGKMIANRPIDEMVLLGLNWIENPNQEAQLHELFPHTDLLSDQIEADKWLESHLYQKPVYLVIRKGREKECLFFLNENNIPSELYDDSVLKLPPESKADKLTDNGLAWVMDRASASAANLVEILPNQSFWDACCGAGGKSIFISNKYNQISEHLCSDRRYSVLENLKSRFAVLDLPQPKTELADLNERLHTPFMADVLLMDVPCSGSGTWGRTPENLNMFDPDSLNFLCDLQKKLVTNALKNLKQNGTLYFMTCSVFKAENEDNVQHFIVNNKLKLIDSGYIHFNFTQTDTLFFAKFI
ncbi:MAG: hypothetical protein JNM67_09865, partial [Bacteroidetes bacterium]|nr:hypothetical protein [Bacteroidota bacterium]